MDGNSKIDVGAQPGSRREPKRKPWCRYWIPRVLIGYLAVGLIAFLVGVVLEWEEAMWIAPFGILWLLVFAALLCMMANARVFPLKYSVFGPYKRTPLPAEKPIWAGTSRGAVGGVGIAHLFQTPFHPFSGWWRVHPSGIVVAVDWVGTGFVHRDDFVSLTETCGGRWVLEHASPELANPIAFYNKDLVAAVQRIMPPR